jgi:hypothetical protein
VEACAPRTSGSVLTTMVTMAQALPAEDELEIRSLVARYFDAVNLTDAVLWKATWATEGRWLIGERALVGREAIVELWKDIMSRYESMVLLVGQGQVWPFPGGAQGRWTTWEVNRPCGAANDTLGIGCYVDRYVQQDGRWLFAEREFHPARYRGQLPAGQFTPFPRSPELGPSMRDDDVDVHD